MLIRKSLIVGYRSLEIEAVAAILRIIAMPQELRAVFQDRVHQVTLIITTARRTVVVRRLAARDIGMRKVVVRERYFRAQTRGDELQVLLYGKQTLYLAARTAVVTVLRTHRPRVVAVGRSQGNSTVGIDGRVHKRRSLEGFLKHLIRARVALAQHLQVTTHIETQHRGLRYIQVHIRTQVEAVQTRCRAVRQGLVHSHDTFLTVVRTRQRVAQTLATTRHIQVHTRAVRHIVGDGIYPIYIGVQVRVVAAICLEDLVFREGTTIGVGAEVVEQVHVLCRTDKLRQLRRRRERLLHTDIYTRRSHRTTLRVNQYHAVGTAHTVHSRSRRVFQHRERLYLCGVNVVERTLHTIHQHQRRSVARERRYTTNPEVRVVVARLTRGLHGNHTRQLTRKVVAH